MIKNVISREYIQFRGRVRSQKREVKKEIKRSRQLTKNRVSFAREENTLRRVMVSDKISSRTLNGMKTIRKLPGHWESLFLVK